MAIAENLGHVSIEDEMKGCYLDYAMSVIVGRALPDVRDGLKPVHRRILYAMHDMGLACNRAPKKSARLVGEVLGKYHPHGDTAVYDAIVRMVQDFSLRYPLVDGQGNFGSVDGDSAAAMRYTEVRMTVVSETMLLDIDKETVDFTDNFDASLKEPTVLPARLPNLLVNGSTGIAVGMATNIPPHNLREVVDALLGLIDNPELSIAEIASIIKGPDFPTGGMILGSVGIKSALSTGRGIVKIRGKTHFESLKSGKESIIITELPYQVNKARLVERMAELVREKIVPGISDLRDESDRDGMRVVIELKRNEVPDIVLNQLFKHTSLQSSFGIIMLALVDNRPRVLNIKQVLKCFIDHRRNVIIRRTNYELRKSEARAHILRGLVVALDNIDRVIVIIRGAHSPVEAKSSLMDEFALSTIQSQAILDMKLQRLTGLEREKIESELGELLKYIAYLKEILSSDLLIAKIIKEELVEIRDKFGDDRKTEIIAGDIGEIDIEDLITEENIVVIVSRQGYIKRNSMQLYRMQRRRGQGARGITTKEEDFAEHMFVTSTHSYLLFFTDKGKVYWLKGYQIPEAGRQAKGVFLANLLSIDKTEKVSAILPIREFSENLYLTMATERGVVKKTELSAYANPRAGGIIAIKLDENDSLINVEITDGSSELVLGTKNGKAIRFSEEQVRSTGRAARGVRGITLRGDDRVVGMVVLEEGSTILTVTENGFGKRTVAKRYTAHNRGGIGMINIKTSDRNGCVVGIKRVNDDDSVMLISDGGSVIWMAVKEIPSIGRNTLGVRLQNIIEGSKLSAIARLAEKDIDIKAEDDETE